MLEKSPKHKRIRHYHEPGDCHELTFSCYRRLPLLASDHWRRMLSESIHDALAKFAFRLVACVYMPEHVHLLVYPVGPPDIARLLAAIKRPHSARIKTVLQQEDSPLLAQLTIRERPGRTVFRYWQEGPGYDRNLSSQRAVLSAIDYIHLNPVRRGLCAKGDQWKWSSCRHYLLPQQPSDPDLPTIHGLPPEFFSG